MSFICRPNKFNISTREISLLLICKCRSGTCLGALVYGPFSNRVGHPLHYISSYSGVLMKSIGAEFLRPDAPPDANHMRGVQYQIVPNIAFN